MDTKNLQKVPVRAFGTKLNIGTRHKINEDALLTSTEQGLFIVADGFGGIGIGDFTASKILDDIKTFVVQSMSDSEATMPFVYKSGLSATGNLLFNAALYANERTYSQNLKCNVNGRGGASVVAALMLDNVLTLMSCGSCSAWQIRGDHAKRLVIPHTYESFSGHKHPSAAFPLNAIGLIKDPELEVREFKVQTGDVILLGSDGIFFNFTPAEISQRFSGVINKNHLDFWLNEQNRVLSETAIQSGNQDNQALISIVCA